MERLIVVPFRHVFEKPRKKRARIATAFAKEFLEKHVKKPVKLSMAVNEFITGKGENIPRRIRVIVKDEKDYMIARLENEKPVEKKEKPKKKVAEKTEEKKTDEKPKKEVKAEKKKVKKDDKGGKD